MPMISGRLAVTSSRIRTVPLNEGVTLLRMGYAFLGHDRRHQVRGRDVEGVVGGGMPVRRDLRRVALLDRDVDAAGRRRVDRRGGRGDQEGDSVPVGQYSQRIGPDLVGHVAIRRYAV